MLPAVIPSPLVWSAGAAAAVGAAEAVVVCGGGVDDDEEVPAGRSGLAGGSGLAE